MLKKLYISNYALIDTLEITLDSGLTTITGETGAGKSILLGALSLLLGARSDIKKARDTSRKIIVEGTFDAAGYGLAELFEENSLDFEDDELLLRREVTPTGRSRAFVNDTPVTTSLLSQIASRLVDIHSQHQNRLIGTRSFQISVLDALAENDEEKRAYTDCFSAYVEMRRRLDKLREDAARRRENEEFIRFRLEQLRKLRPRSGEQSELERRQEILAGSASISEAISSACALFNAGDKSVLASLHEIKSVLQGVNLGLFEAPDEDPQATLPLRLESSIIELTDISETLAGYLDRVETDPRLLAKVEERLNALYEAERRFNVADEQGLVELHEKLEAEFAAIENGDTDIFGLEAEVKEKGRMLKRLADALTKTRSRTAAQFARQLTEVAAPLGMQNMKFSAVISAGKLTANGQDTPSFMCTFNKNMPLMPVEEIASGGEISRLMLCLKSIVASRMNLPTVIFDEVDTGVSGDIAARMAQLMQQIAADIQVLAITHLPQIAASGDAHFKVYKEDSADATHTHIRRLDPQERITETARMLAGTTIDDAALSNARSLLEHSARKL